MKESRQEYIERMAAIAVKKNWQSGDFEWLNNHLGKNDLVADIQKRLTPREPDSLKAGVLSLPAVVKSESNLPA